MRLRGQVEMLWLVARVFGSTCVLPLRMRSAPLPVLLQRLTAHPRAGGIGATSLNVERVARVVERICQIRVFRSRLFPRACVRQSFALYRALTGLGYPVVIHFGVRKNGEMVAGHSWVTLHGQVIAERPSVGRFEPVYSYPT